MVAIGGCYGESQRVAIMTACWQGGTIQRYTEKNIRVNYIDPSTFSIDCVKESSLSDSP